MTTRDDEETTRVSLDDAEPESLVVGDEPAVRWNEEQAWEQANKGTSSVLPFVNAFFLTVATVLVRNSFVFSFSHRPFTFFPVMFQKACISNLFFYRNLLFLQIL